MKKLLFASLLVFIYVAGQAQSFTLVNPVTHYSNSNVSQISQGFLTVHNGAIDAKNVMVERTVNNLSAGHTGYFCWNVCYAETVDVSTGYLTIQPNTDNNSFYCDIDPHGVAGMDTVCYRFFDQNDANDNVDICLYFDIGSTGVATVTTGLQSALSVASPNPANTLSGISYNTDVTKNPTLAIYDLLGGKIFEAKLLQKQGSLILNVSDFKEGIYIYSLLENGKTIATKKLVVAHK